MENRRWEIVRTVPALGAGDVHVWRDDVSATAPGFSPDSLTDVERGQADRMTAPVRRSTFIRARSFLRHVASAYVGLLPATVPIRILDKGKPVIDRVDESEPLAVSVSHSGSAIAVAVTRVGDVGIDVERIDPLVDRAAIARRFFSGTESAALDRFGPVEQLRAFFALWVRKEAVLKACGGGLTIPLAEVEFTGPATPEPTLTRLPRELGEAAEWTILGVPADEAMASAIAVRGQVTTVRCLQWASQD